MASLPSYERAEVEMFKVIRDAVFRSSSLIGAISEQPTRHNSPNVNLIEPVVIEHELLELSAIFEIHRDVIKAGDVETYTEIVTDALYKGFVIPMEKHFVESISDLAIATGNSVDAAKEGLNAFEAFLTVLEKIEMNLDEEDNLILPTIAANPDTIKNLTKERFGSDERERLDLLLQRKRSELLRNKKTRRLTLEVDTSDSRNT